MGGQRPMRAQYHHLAGTGVAAYPKLAVQPRFACQPVGRHHHDDAAGVFATGGDCRLDRVLEDLFGVGDNHQGEHPAECDRTTLFAQRGDALVDVVGRGVR